MNYLIADKTANTGAIYIGEGGENCHLEENAMIFESDILAQIVIDKNGWKEWAYVSETDYPVNQ